MTASQVKKLPLDTLETYGSQNPMGDVGSNFNRLTEN